jgi:hypothetical protein
LVMVPRSAMYLNSKSPNANARVFLAAHTSASAARVSPEGPPVKEAGATHR